MPAPYSFWPRDHVRNAGPLNQVGDLLLARHGEVVVDAGQCHPIQQLLPLHPAIPDETVAVRAHVHEVEVIHEAAAHGVAAAAGHRRPASGNLDSIVAAPARPTDGHIAALAQVEAQSGGQGGRIRCRDGDAPVGGVGDRETVTSRRVRHRQLKVRRPARQQALDERKYRCRHVSAVLRRTIDIERIDRALPVM